MAFRRAVLPAFSCISRRGCRRFAGSWAYQETPNPDVGKFESGTALPSIARVQLLELEGVRDVFIGGDGGGSSSSGSWIAVTRDREADWQTLVPRVKEVLSSLPEDSADMSMPQTTASQFGEDSVAQSIAEVLEHRVRPSVQDDGGDVELLEWNADSGR
eukprot:gb/GFBE01047452.1/.p1 GENE.gb/GFBE01047452.1/~~gb/GFBE01047452.1/.p1  ORF type:complete len:159 (+),score=26.58 gb/GFBE01047452.1/:1-477(+)